MVDQPNSKNYYKSMTKLDPSAAVTNKTLQEAVDGIMGGMDRIIVEMRTGFKYLMKNMATKEDLKREIGWLKDDVNGLTADLANTPTQDEFNKLRRKVDKYLVA